MEFVNKVENRVADWYNKVPHLPVGFREWLGVNVWWIMLIVVVLSVIGVLNIFMFGALAAVFVGGFGGPVGAAIVGVALLIGLLVLAATLLETIITAIAIKPLKDKQKKGWSLLLLALLVAAGFSVLTFLFSFELSSLVMSALWIAVSGYFLFEIRDQFNGGVDVKAAKVMPRVAPVSENKKK
ncbi:MAG TPA: hypothetical protein VF281_00755 [Candidatus Saccharimonadales bacterium]